MRNILGEAAQHTFFSSTPRTWSTVDHTMARSQNKSTKLKIELIPNTFSDLSGMTLKFNNTRGNLETSHIAGN
jgi:hypothetical protein